MRFAPVLIRTLIPILVLASVALAQTGSESPATPQPKSVTVPIKLDHNRVIVDVDLPLRDGTVQRVHAWFDNGNSDLYLSQRLFERIGGSLNCDGQLCSGTPPVEMTIGGMRITLGGRIPGAGIREAKVPAGGAPIAPGLNAEINIPSSVLRNYDVLVDFPGRQLTISQPSSLKFKGVKSKMLVNAGSLIQIPSQIENKKYNLGLDLGSSISFLSEDLFDRLAAAHPDWPHMTGAIGPANMWGSVDEPKQKIMRLERLQYGPLFLTNVAVADLSGDRRALLEKRAGIPTAGVLGAEALMNYRVGLDYAHSAVYFEIGRTFNFPDFDVIGLILRPENDGRFTILGIADYDGKPSVAQGENGVQMGDHLVAVDNIPVSGSTMGQVWAILGGEPGKQRVLTVERGGTQFTVAARVQHFLGDKPEDDSTQGKSRKN